MASTERDAIASPAPNPTEPIHSSKDFQIFGAPLICDEEKWEGLNCLETGWLGTGPKVAQLEREFYVTKNMTTGEGEWS
jgi:dTDP-4-amino-4,6-dideoxygalactose transaminase